MSAFQSDSARIPDGIPSDSGFNKQASQNSNGNTPSSLSDEQRGRLAELAGIIVTLRPDWRWLDVFAAVKADDRPWRTVVAGSIRGALLDGPDTIRHPNGLRYVNPTHGDTIPRLPTPAELDRAPRCPHGAVSGTCALCRNGVSP